MRILAAVLCLVLATLPARADGVLQKLITPEDQARLDQFDAVKEKALREARAGGAPADVKILDAAMAGTPLAVEGDFDATGKWKCRTIKMGGGLALTVYAPFKCTVSDDGSGWFLKKVSGSQRTQGRFYTEGATRMIYLGAGHIYDERRASTATIRRRTRWPWWNVWRRTASCSSSRSRSTSPISICWCWSGDQLISR